MLGPARPDRDARKRADETGQAYLVTLSRAGSLMNVALNTESDILRAWTAHINTIIYTKSVNETIKPKIHGGLIVDILS